MKIRNVAKKKRKSKIYKSSRDAIKHDFTPFIVILGIIFAPIALFFLSGGFRASLIGFAAKIVDILVLSNLFVFNLVVILILILLIMVAVYVYRRL